jgi:hypothetical protein
MSRHPFSDRLTWYRDIGQPDLVARWKNTPSNWPAEKPRDEKPAQTLVCYLGSVLVRQTDSSTGLVQQSQEQLAAELATNARTIGRAMRLLEYVGWLELVKKAVGPGRGGSKGRPAQYRITGLAAHIATLAELSTDTQETPTSQDVPVLGKHLHQEHETPTSRAETPTSQDVPSSVFSSDSSSREKVSEQVTAGTADSTAEEEKKDQEALIWDVLLTIAGQHGAKNASAYAAKMRSDKTGAIKGAVERIATSWPSVPHSRQELSTYLQAKIKGEQISTALVDRLDELETEHRPPPALRAIS